MKIQETADSRKAQFIALAHKFFKKYKASGSHSELMFDTAKTWSGAHGHYAFSVRGSTYNTLFDDGTWTDIGISVMTEPHFEPCVQLAKAYEELTKCSATVFKFF